MNIYNFEFESSDPRQRYPHRHSPFQGRRKNPETETGSCCLWDDSERGDDKERRDSERKEGDLKTSERKTACNFLLWKLTEKL
jgi:hypothetical protein